MLTAGLDRPARAPGQAVGGAAFPPSAKGARPRQPRRVHRCPSCSLPLAVGYAKTEPRAPERSRCPRSRGRARSGGGRMIFGVVKSASAHRSISLAAVEGPTTGRACRHVRVLEQPIQNVVEDSSAGSSNIRPPTNRHPHAGWSVNRSLGTAVHAVGTTRLEGLPRTRCAPVWQRTRGGLSAVSEGPAPRAAGERQLSVPV